jgi:hypothetical protein
MTREGLSLGRMRAMAGTNTNDDGTSDEATMRKAAR